MSSWPIEMEAELEALRLRLEAANLRGLAEAADALLGECPEAVCGVLESWELVQAGELPRLADACWEALAPLRVSAPPGPVPGVLEGLLAGLHTETQAALDALRGCADRADSVALVHSALPPASGARHSELWRWALASALDDFWALMADIYARARPVLLRHDHADTVRFLELERILLGEVIERVEVLADRVASIDDATQLDSVEPAASVPPDPTSVIGGVPPDPLTPSGWLARPERIPVRVAGPRPMWSAEEPRGWLPVAFLAVATGLAVVVLVVVAYGSPSG